MSAKPPSSIIHHEDSGSIYSSIRDDGTIIHWCDKCGSIWISKEQPESEIPYLEREKAKQFVLKLRETLRMTEGVAIRRAFVTESR